MLWHRGTRVFSAFVLAVSIPAYADGLTTPLRVGCPALWPGTNSPSAFLVKNDIWEFAVTDVIPGGEIPINARDPETVSLNCHYSNGLRMTVVVPGITSACYFDGDAKAAPPRYTYFCLTRPDADGAMGPIRAYIVEPVTLKTRIDGLGLRMSRAEILDIAKTRGLQIIDGESNPLRLRLGDEDVTVLLSTNAGLSKDVVFWYEPRKGTRYRETAYRFGLDRNIGSTKYPGGRSRDSLWRSSIDSSEIEILREPNDKRLTIHLRDRTAE